MQTYRITINDRDYTSWTYYNIDTNVIEELEINPIEHKLLSGDIFTLQDNIVTIISSPYRYEQYICGILVLENNKTYGRSNDKLLYKCIPDKSDLPAFIIPYEMKEIGFSKIFSNMYITFKFSKWETKHPLGCITQSIGPVNFTDKFYEYQIHCKKLNQSNKKFTKDTMSLLKKKTREEYVEIIKKNYPNIEDRTNRNIWKVFSIDPIGSMDFDDAHSIRILENGTYLLSIYISNVTIWLDVLNLWKSVGERISTIYMPNCKHTMLPTILSDKICSLIMNQQSIAFTMDVYIDPFTFTIKEIKYVNSMIDIYNNYRYEEPSLLKDYNYVLLKKMCGQINYNILNDSHDVVEFLMKLMNQKTGEILKKHKNGIFRSNTLNMNQDSPIPSIIPSIIPNDIKNFITIWKNSTSQYTIFKEHSMFHHIMGIDCYVHITSPIRRLVDLLNIIQFQQNTKMIELNNESITFYNKWYNKIDYINTTMKNIRRVQSDCMLLQLCSTTVNINDTKYNGYILDKNKKNDMYIYSVYLPELKLVSSIITKEELDIYMKYEFKLYLFKNEYKLKSKIRLMLL